MVLLPGTWQACLFLSLPNLNSIVRGFMQGFSIRFVPLWITNWFRVVLSLAVFLSQLSRGFRSDSSIWTQVFVMGHLILMTKFILRPRKGQRFVDQMTSWNWLRALWTETDSSPVEGEMETSNDWACTSKFVCWVCFRKGDTLILLYVSDIIIITRRQS